MIEFLHPTLLRSPLPSSHCSRLWPSPVIALGARLDLHPSKPQESAGTATVGQDIEGRVPRR